jgi:glycine hydroxymethyltransferase
MPDFLFRGELSEFDPRLAKLNEFEEERQFRKLILIPSESSSPLMIREALGTAFHNIYAEGYPPEHTRWLSEDEIFNYSERLTEYRRYSDPRYYKGVEYADILEALARRRCAEVFAANGLTPDDLYVNVQALSGGPANNAVYHALVNLGDTVMGMDLLHGGHLSHGSPVNRSGKFFNIVPYSVNPKTERLDYDEVEGLAIAHKPKMIIAGVSSYPWMLDWRRFRSIADKVGAYLFADIAHVAGMVAAGVYDSPVGIADVVTFTTHKSLCGPRGAVILTSEKKLARKIDRAVFPGEQGGPHVNVFAGIALAFKLAKTDKFRRLQSQALKNCKVFTHRFIERGFRVAFNGSNTHLMNLDCKTIRGENGAYLSGDMAARILDIAGVVTNRNTIPGDKSALNPSGVRMGTHWITQRGFSENDCIQLADIIGDILESIRPYYQEKALRAKVDFQVLESSKIKIREMAFPSGMDYFSKNAGYPHFYYLDHDYRSPWIEINISGERVRQFLNFSLGSDIESLQDGQSQATRVYTHQGWVDGAIICINPLEFKLSIPGDKAGLVAAWLRDLSDGYIYFDADLLKKIPGPVVVAAGFPKSTNGIPKDDVVDKGKPYYIGIMETTGEELPDFNWQQEEVTLKRTPLYGLHVELGAKMVPFAGWEMPVRYSSVMEEHQAVREAAGVFDVTHMGVYQAEGPDAVVFLDSICGNDIASLETGESLYTHFLDPDGSVIDDLIVYRRSDMQYLLVVNASNDDKDWAWLSAVRDGLVKVDRSRPWSRAFGRGVVLRNLRDPQETDEMRVDIALQGPKAVDILFSLGADPSDLKKILKLKRTELCEAVVGGYDLIISRTGYTGEKIGFELFVHPEHARNLFQDLLDVGIPLGLKPIGLGARDSLRIEAGLPLYGHEMGGELDLTVAEAGFGYYVKTYKPWFIGRDAFLKKVENQKGVVIRFRFDEKGVRMAHLGDPVVDKRGKVIGRVTSCSADQEGFLVGQAYIDFKYGEEGNTIFVYQGSPKKEITAPSNLRIGDRSIIPTSATVISRFLK